MADGIRCSRCEQALAPEAFAPSQRRDGFWCRSCHKAYMADYNKKRGAELAQARYAIPRICRSCGSRFVRWERWRHPGSAATHCQPCYNEKVRLRQSKGKPRRERLTDEEYLTRIFAEHPFRKGMQLVRSGRRWQARRSRFIEDLDSFDCGICGEPVDMSLGGHHRMGPTIDHIVPVALGGAVFDEANLRLAHRSCNSKGGRQHERMEALALRNAAEWLGDRLLSTHL